MKTFLLLSAALLSLTTAPALAQTKVSPLGLAFDPTGATGAAKGDLSNVPHSAFQAAAAAAGVGGVNSVNGSTGAVSVTAASIGANNAANLTGTAPVATTPAFSGGDATKPAGSGAITLNTVNSTPGACVKPTVNAKGLASACSGLAASDVTGGLGYAPVNRAGDTITGPLGLNSTLNGVVTQTAPTSDGFNFDFQNSSMTGYQIYSSVYPAGARLWDNLRLTLDLEPGASVGNAEPLGFYVYDNEPVQNGGAGIYQSNAVGIMGVMVDAVNGAASFGENFTCNDTAAGQSAPTATNRTCIGNETDFTVAGLNSTIAGQTLFIQGSQTPLLAFGWSCNKVTGSTAAWNYCFSTSDGAMSSNGFSYAVDIGSTVYNVANSPSQVQAFHYWDSANTRQQVTEQANATGALNVLSSSYNDGVSFVTGSGNVAVNATGSDANVNLILGAKGTAQIILNSGLPSVRLVSSTFAGLPTCSAATAGEVNYITDANAPTYNANLSGGGSTKTLALCNGSSWTAH